MSIIAIKFAVTNLLTDKTPDPGDFTDECYRL